MTEIDPNLSGAGNGDQDGGNANLGGGNSQGQGGNGTGNGGQDPNRGQGGSGQAGDDYKVKFGESTKENQRLMQVMKEAGLDPKTGKKADAGAGAGADDGSGAGEQPIFTDEDLQAAFPSFATMSDQERGLLKQVGSFPKMMRMVAEMYDKNTFGEQLDTIKADPANKLIADNEKEFRAFAYKDGNLKLPMDVLVDAFIGKKLRAQAAAGTGNGAGDGKGKGKTAKRDGMETGTSGQGGSGDAAAEITAEQASELRKKDPRKYATLARTGKLRIVSE